MCPGSGGLRWKVSAKRSLDTTLHPMPTRAQKITFGELRASGLNRVIVYCRDYTCSQFHNAQRPAAALISPSATSRSD